MTMTPQELNDADRDLNPTRREAIKTTLLTSVQAILRLFFVSAIIFLMGDWLLNRDVRNTLVADTGRAVAWIEGHKQDFLKLLIQTAKHDTQSKADKAIADTLHNTVHDLQVRLRETESAVSVLHGTNHHHNGDKK